MKRLWLHIVKPNATLAKLLLLLLLAAVIWLNYTGKFEGVKAVLSAPEFTYAVGTYQLTVYTVFKGLIVVSISFWLAGWLSDLVERRVQAISRLQARSKIIITKTFQTLLYLVVCLFVLDVLGVDMTALGLLGGAIGIGIGFGLQKITSNFISGLILLAENSIEIGDLVELSDGLYGFVRHTGARYTLLETVDGKEVMIPNEDFVTNRVTNWTYSNSSGRIEIKIGVSYNSDVDQVKQILIEAAQEFPACMELPPVDCFLEEFADSAVQFGLYFWIEDITAGRKAAKSHVMRTIWYKFKEQGIVIPFPQRDIHMITDS